MCIILLLTSRENFGKLFYRTAERIWNESEVNDFCIDRSVNVSRGWIHADGSITCA